MHKLKINLIAVERQHIVCRHMSVERQDKLKVASEDILLDNICRITGVVSWGKNIVRIHEKRSIVLYNLDKCHMLLRLSV